MRNSDRWTSPPCRCNDEISSGSTSPSPPVSTLPDDDRIDAAADAVEAEEDAAASNPSRRVVDEQTDVLNDDEVVQQF